MTLPDRAHTLFSEGKRNGSWSRARNTVTDATLPPESVHYQIIHFGPHIGKPYTRLPIQYLRWLVNKDVQFENANKMALAELQRRGISLEKRHVDVSMHAIDRVTTDYFDVYLEHRASPREGVASWLFRTVENRLSWNSPSAGQEDFHLHGLRFIVRWGCTHPTLVTLFRPGSNADTDLVNCVHCDALFPRDKNTDPDEPACPECREKGERYERILRVD